MIPKPTTITWTTTFKHYRALLQLEGQVLRFQGAGQREHIGMFSIPSVGWDKNQIDLYGHNDNNAAIVTIKVEEWHWFMYGDNEPEPLITIPLLAGNASYTANIPSNIEEYTSAYYGNSIIITPHDRKRWNQLAGLRDRKNRLTLCVTRYAYDDDLYGDIELCQHPPEEHDKNGCNHIIYDDYGSSTCGCEGYTKPAPLAVVDPAENIRYIPITAFVPTALERLHNEMSRLLGLPKEFFRGV